MPDKDDRGRSPVLKTAAYSPLVAGSIYAAEKFKGFEFNKPSAYEDAIAASTRLARNVLDGQGIAAPSPDDASYLAENLLKEGTINRIQKNSNVAIRAFGAAMTDANSTLEREMMDKALAKAMTLFDQGSPKTGRFMAETLKRAGVGSALKFRNMFESGLAAGLYTKRKGIESLGRTPLSVLNIADESASMFNVFAFEDLSFNKQTHMLSGAGYKFRQDPVGGGFFLAPEDLGNKFNPLNRLNKAGLQFRPVGEIVGGAGGENAARYLQVQLYRGEAAQDAFYNLPLRSMRTGQYSEATKNMMLLGSNLTPYRTTGMITSKGRELRGHQLQQELYRKSFGAISKGVFGGKSINPLGALSAHQNFLESISSMGRHLTPSITSGQALRRELQGNLLFPEESFGSIHPANREKVISAYENMVSKYGGAELLSPSSLVKGGYIPSKIVTNVGEINFSRIMENRGAFKDMDRIAQFVRDTSLSPTNWVARAFGLRQVSNGIGMAAPRQSALEGALEFDMFRGAAHTSEMEKIGQGFGYIGPQARVLHVADEKIIEKLSYKFNVNEGEGLITAVKDQTGRTLRQEDVVGRVAEGLVKSGKLRSTNLSNLTTKETKIFESALRKTFRGEGFGNLIRIAAPSQYQVMGPTQGKMLGANFGDLFQGGTRTFDKPIRLTPGLELGLSPEGGILRSMRDPGVIQEVISQELNPNTGIYTLHMKNTQDFSVLAKTYGHEIGRLNVQSTGADVMAEAAETAEKANKMIQGSIKRRKFNIIAPGTAATKMDSGRGIQMVTGLMDELRFMGSARNPAQEQLYKTLFNPSDWKPMAHLRKYIGDLGYKIADTDNFDSMTMLAAKRVGLTSEQASFVFGLWGHENKNRQKWLRKTFGKDVRTGVGSGGAGLYVEEMGRSLTGIPQGSVERRHLETLQTLMQDPKTRPVAELLYEETIGETASLQKKLRFQETHRLQESITGSLSPDELAKFVDPKNIKSDYAWGSLKDYWPKEATLVNLSKEQASALGTKAIYLPGRGSITRSELGNVMSKANIVQEKILGRLGANIDDMMMATGPAGRLSPHEVESALSRTKEAVVEEIRSYHNEMFEGKLGPSSAYMYGKSVSLNEEGLRRANILTKPGVVSGYGGRWGFISKMKAEQMFADSTEQLERAGQEVWYEAKITADHAEMLSKMQGRGGLSAAQLHEMTYRQAYLAGSSPHPSMLIRHPENRLTSVMAGYAGVHDLPGGDDLIIIGEKFEEASKSLDIPNFKKRNRFSIAITGFTGGDLDGDSFNVKLLMNQKTPGVLMDPRQQHLQEYTMTMLENRVQTEIIREQLTKGFKEIAKETLDEMNPKHAEILSLFMTKGEVPKLSLRITELNTAMRHFSGDPRMSMLGQTILSELEETLTLKGRKVKNPIPLAVKIADALAPGTGERADFGEFRMVLEDLLNKGGYAGVDKIPVELEGHHVEFSLATADDIVKSMETAWTDYQGSIQEAYTQAVRMGMKSKNLSDVTIRKGLVDFIGKGATAEQYFSSIMTGGSGRSMARKLLDEFSWTKGLIKSIERTKFPKGLAAPLMLGLAGTAAALTMFGGPGYGPEPITPKGVKIDPNVSKAIQDGTLLMASQRPSDAKLTPDAIQPQYSGGGPQANPMVMAPTARIASRNSVMRVSSRGDHLNTQLDRFMGGLDARFNRANINARIRDDRRPLVPSQSYY